MTRENLCKMARHIQYEADMFQFTFEATQSPRPWPQDSIMLECFLLHWRNLWYFFLEPPPKDDVIASDYIASWKADRPSPDFKTRVHTLLAHITKDRLGQKEFSSQEVGVMHGQIATLWTEFYEQLTSDEERAWFTNDLKHKFPVTFRGPRSPLLLR